MVELSKEEEYILDESSEISVGEKPFIGKIADIFPALKNKNYRYFFLGGLVSLIGTWLQIVAEGWLVLKLTNSPFLIGLVAAAATVPTLLFSLFGGVIVDRYPKKKILIFTQTASMILALIYGVLTVLGLINISEIITLAFLLGTVTALDMPARQAFNVELVGKEDLSSAISLGAGAFNAARVIGPSIAGIIIAVWGSGGAFILNGLSYIAVIIALFAMDVVSVAHPSGVHPLRAIKEGVSYSAKHPVIRTLLIYAGIISIFGWSYTTLMPYIAEHTFHLGATGLGYMYAATGLGALVSTVLVSYYSKKVSSTIFIVGGNLIFSIAIILFSFTNNVIIALPFLFFAGVGLLSTFSVMNTTIQHLVEDQYRGRVMSIYTIMFLGMAPLGNLEVGFVSEHLGTLVAIRIGVIITLVFAAIVYLLRKRIAVSYQEYKNS